MKLQQAIQALASFHFFIDCIAVDTFKMKVHELPQFTALQTAATSFKTDEKLHLRNLCSDSSRCAGLVASHEADSGAKIILDYSRQQVSGVLILQYFLFML